MKILAFAASNSRASINGVLVRHAAERLCDAVAPRPALEILDLNAYEMPIFSVDRQAADGIPDAAHRFFGKIGAADALIISYAEHNGSYTAAWKNVFDWMSRIDTKVFQGKPTVILSTSPGGRGAASVMAAAKTSAPIFGAEVRGAVSIAKWREAYDPATQSLTRESDVAALDAALQALREGVG